MTRQPLIKWPSLSTFDTVVHYNIADGIMTEPGSELFGASLTKADLQNVIDHFDETEFGKKIKAGEQG